MRASSDLRREHALLVVLVVSIDVECDKNPHWEIQKPLRFDSVTQGLPRVLEPVFRRFEIVPTLLLSPEVIRDEGAMRVLTSLPHCELGTHLHGEFIEPHAVPDPAITSDPQSRYSPEVEQAKLKNLTELFVSRVGRRPTSFRAGCWAATGRTVGFLDELGYLVDSSVTPFRTNVFPEGSSCNHWGAPLRPYRPSRSDIRRNGGLNLLEVPVTILRPSFARWPAAILRRLSDRTMQRSRILSVLHLSPKQVWLRPFRGTAAELTAWADLVIASWRGTGPAILNIMFHSVDATPGASPTAQTVADVARLSDDLSGLFQHLRGTYDVTAMGLSALHGKFS
jgi:hypothetical protein